jgi:hypothetical protein
MRVAVASGVLLVLALVAATPVANGKRPALPPLRYTGTAQGGLEWKEHRVSRDNPPSLVLDQNGEDKGVFSFSFTVNRKTGVVTGSGTGRYTSATWHLELQDDAGTFTCDVPIQTNTFRVKVSGKAVGGRIDLALSLPNALDTNDDTKCGDYTAYSSPGNSLDYALKTAGGRKLKVSKSAGAPLISLSNEQTYSYVAWDANPVVDVDATVDFAWSISIRKR